MIEFLRRKSNRYSFFADSEVNKTTDQGWQIINFLRLDYYEDHLLKSFHLPGQPGDNSLSVKITVDNRESLEQGIVLTLALEQGEESCPIDLKGFYIELEPEIPARSKMTVNGFQSWSRSEEVGANDRIAPLFFPAKLLLAPYGDYNIFSTPGDRGHFHSWTYTLFHHHRDDALLLASLEESTGYTIFEYDFDLNVMRVHKDCLGVKVKNGFQLLKIYIGRGNLNKLFKEYGNNLRVTRKSGKKATGWCSWYNYYTGVSESIVRENLKNLKKKEIPLTYFQIDDGWQNAIGDWLGCNDKFPSGMKSLCEEIKSFGYEPGLWLAPLIAVPSSEIFKKNPGWLLRDQRGKPLKAGFNPGWEGFFYALDIYNPGVRDYLKRVFETIQEDWGYGMLKFDFLYAAALLPLNGKSRGTVMWDTVNFIEHHTRKSIILGCGVPLGSAAGNFDYCRIGSDVSPYWEDYLAHINYRERVSTENAITSVINRSFLDSTFFRNDPDVFILRDGTRGVNENRLSLNQRNTLFLINNLFGGLIFFSDNVNELNSEQIEQIAESYPLCEAEIKDRRFSEMVYCIEFALNKRNYLAYINMSRVMKKLILPEGYYFSAKTLLQKPGAEILLEPFESVSLIKAAYDREKVTFLGTSGHVFPGAQIEYLAIDDCKIDFRLFPDAYPKSKIYFAVPHLSGCYTVNGQVYRATRENDFNYLTV
ncbi:MAG: alpha-galactosidase [Bacillota bacterium]|nr:alpha-galactosidase [Bacillota bacterium]